VEVQGLGSVLAGPCGGEVRAALGPASRGGVVGCGCGQHCAWPRGAGVAGAGSAAPCLAGAGLWVRPASWVRGVWAAPRPASGGGVVGPSGVGLRPASQGRCCGCGQGCVRDLMIYIYNFH
jgi:hypothetical protein